MYILLEIQVNDNGQVGTLITNYSDLREAESRFYTVMAAAALSELPVHSAVLMTEKGLKLKNGWYTHDDEGLSQ